MKPLSHGHAGNGIGFPKRKAAVYILAAIFSLIFSSLLGFLIFYSSATGAPGPSIISIASSIHPDENTWYANSNPNFSWKSLDIRLAGSYDTPGNAYDVAISGNYAYVADNTQGLQIINITNPAAPFLTATIATSEARGVAVSGSYAFVADGNAGLKIFNISTPASPSLAGSRDTPGYALDVAVSGSYAYVADSDPGLQVINISNPASPVISGAYDTGWAQGVAVSGSYAYVADSYTGLQIVNISSPGSPSSAGSYDTPGAAEGVAVSGSYAYVADWTSGLEVFDVSNPATPLLRGAYDTDGAAMGVAIYGSEAFVADGNAGFKLIDVSIPTNPYLKGSCDTPGLAHGIAVSGNSFAYIADQYTFQVVNIYPAGYSYVLDQSPGTAPDTISEGTALSVAYTGKTDGIWYFHVMAKDSLGNWGPVSHRMIRIDTTGPPVSTLFSSTHPVETNWYPSRSPVLNWKSADIYLKGFYDTPGAMLGVTVSGSRAYVADHESGLEILDVNNPASPVLLGVCDTPGTAASVAVSGNYAYVADGATGLQIVDVSNPAAPVLRGSYATPDVASSVAISGSYAYVADNYFGLQIINVSDPAHPTFAGSYYDGETYSQDVEVVGRYAYVADYYAGLKIIDVFNPAAPVLVGAYDTPGGASGVAVSGSYAYVADYDTGLQIINITNPGAPVAAGVCDTPGVALGVAVSGSSAYVADGYGGLQVIDISSPASPALKGSFATAGDALGVAYAGSHVFVAEFLAGMEIISAQDPNGYSFVLDQAPGTVPDVTSEGTGTSLGASVGSDGIWYFHIRARDYLGNWGPASHRTLRIDTIPPDTTDNAPLDWQGSNFTFTLSPTENGSGWAATYYRIDSGAWQSGTSVAITTEGNHIVSYYSRDNAGNSEATNTVNAMLDKTAPATSDDAPPGWVNYDGVTVHLDGNDTGGSGLSSTCARADGGYWICVGSGIHLNMTFNIEGDHLLEYYSDDFSGNTELIKTVHVKIDRTPPVTTADAPSGWQGKPFKVPLSCTDTAGCLETHFIIDGGPEEIGGSVLIETEGDHTISYHSLDNAGNEEAPKTVHAKLDTSAPLVTNLSPSGNVNGSSQTISADLPDSYSGIAAERASIVLRDKPLEDCTVISGHISCLVSDLDPGEYPYTVSVKDGAGHTGTNAGVFSIITEPAESPFIEKWTALGGAPGACTDASQTIAGGKYQDFIKGRLYWNQSIGSDAGAVFWVRGSILDKFENSYGGVGGAFGLPTSDETNVTGISGAKQNTFTGGVIYYGPGVGTYGVSGAIGAKYLAAPSGRPVAYGLPTGDEQNLTLGGKSQTTQRSIVTWDSVEGAHVVYGGIMWMYTVKLGGPNGPYGVATTDEIDATGAPGGRESDFKVGRLYWSINTGTHGLQGTFLDRYLANGGPAGCGLPVTDAYPVWGGYAQNMQGAYVTWRSDLGGGVGRLVRGGVFVKYQMLGGPGGALHLIREEEHSISVVDAPGAVQADFENGYVFWSSVTGSHPVNGGIYVKYLSVGGPTGHLGLPTTDEYAIALPGGGVRQAYQHGFITWGASYGTWVDYT